MTKEQDRERLEARRWRLLHEFDGSPWRDGLVQQHLDAIERELASMEKADG